MSAPASPASRPAAHSSEVLAPVPMPMAAPPPGLGAVRESEPAFEIAGLRVWFEDREVLHGVSLHIPARAVTAIIGPSGCGKSTLLRSLNRMHELVPGARVSGTIRLFGEDLYGPDMDPTMVRRRVGMVFQKSNPFPTMSIAQNVTVGLRLNGVRNRELLDQKMEQALGQAALWDEVKDRLSHGAATLSGGQQQRLCIARALALQPEVLLMDEPASALDPLATTRIEDLIQELKSQYTIVVVTHNMQQAARVSSYTCFLYLGEVIEFDTTTKVFTNPTHRQTEDYVTGRFG